MPWCPRCVTEYSGEYSVCTTCGSILEDSLPADTMIPRYGAPKLLISLNDVVEADRLEALLDSAGIPAARKYDGAGQYISMIGSLPHLGVDLYVPEEYLDAASELLRAYRTDGADALPERESPEEAPLPDNSGSRRSRAWALVVIFGLGSVLTGIALFREFIATLWGMLFR